MKKARQLFNFFVRCYPPGSVLPSSTVPVPYPNVGDHLRWYRTLPFRLYCTWYLGYILYFLQINFLDLRAKILVARIPRIYPYFVENDQFCQIDFPQLNDTCTVRYRTYMYRN